MAKLRVLIVDACVLIDFAKADLAILTLVSRHVGDVHVPSPVFQEVKDLDPTMAASLGKEGRGEAPSDRPTMMTRVFMGELEAVARSKLRPGEAWRAGFKVNNRGESVVALIWGGRTDVRDLPPA
jgi:hypothetical protein